MSAKRSKLLRQLPLILAGGALALLFPWALLQTLAHDDLSNAAAMRASEQFAKAHPYNAKVVASLEMYLAQLERNKTRPRPPAWTPTRCEQETLSRYDYELDLARSTVKRRWPDSVLKPDWPVPSMPAMSAECQAERARAAGSAQAIAPPA